MKLLTRMKGAAMAALTLFGFMPLTSMAAGQGVYWDITKEVYLMGETLDESSVEIHGWYDSEAEWRNAVADNGSYTFLGGHDGSGLGTVVVPSTIRTTSTVSIGTKITNTYTVVSIGSNAFYNCSKLTSITIPNTVTNIGYQAFCECAGLKTFTIPDSVKTIGDGAFGVCTGLKTFTIPDSVKTIGKSAFGSCTGLTSVTIPASVESIGKSAFIGCTGLTSVTFLGRDVIMEKAATRYFDSYSIFFGCDNLKQILVPEGFTGDFGTLPEGCTVYEVPTIDASAAEGYYDVGEEVAFDVLVSNADWTLKATGLPRGLTAVAGKGVLKISGKPTTAGISTVTLTATNADAPEVTKEIEINVGMMELELATTEDSIGMKSLTGAGTYASGKTAALKAVAEKGYVFAGWYLADEDGYYPCDFGKTDYRTATVSFTMPTSDECDPTEPVCLYAKFASSADDAAVLAAHVDGQEFAADGQWSLDLGEMITSYTIPTVKVAGLPKGLTFDSKAMVISGSPTVPGVYKVTVTLSNSSAKNRVETFTIRVPNLDSAYITPSWKANVDKTLIAGLTTEEDDLFVVVEDGWTLKVTGLPAGLAYDAKTGAITGKPTKFGNYTVTFTATKKGETTQVATRTIVIKGRTVKVVVVEDEEGMKSIAGAGEYAVGAKVSFKAVANKNYVFAGWYKTYGAYRERFEPGENIDYRTANFTYTMPDEDITLYARFETAEEDAQLLTTGLDGRGALIDTEEIYLDEDYEQWLGCDSLSAPTIKVSGLPKGLTFDAKKGLISGMPTVPGIYEVTFTLSNASIKSKTEKYEITVANFNSDVIWGLDNAGKNFPYEYTVGLSSECSELIVTADDGYALKVSGLPAGLKFDSKTGAITGTPTKAGTYTVTFTATKGKDTQVATRTFVVSALPPLLVGTYSGFIRKGCDDANRGTFTMTATEAGKVTAKIVDAQGTYSFSGSWTCSSREDSAVASMKTAKGERLELNFYYTPWTDDGRIGYFYKVGDGNDVCDGNAIYAHKNPLAEKWYLKATANDSGWSFSFVDTAKEAKLTVTPKGDGTVTIAGKIDSYSVSASSTLAFEQMRQEGADVFNANFVTFVTVGKTKKALSMTCHLWIGATSETTLSAGSAKLVD